MYKPPRCPYCNEELTSVREDGSDVYRFNPETGYYYWYDGELEPFCRKCGAELYDIFPDGICNYIPKKGGEQNGVRCGLDKKD